MATNSHGEWVGNLGYVAFATETTVGTAVTPTTFALLDNETMTTNYNLEDQMPIAGIPVETYQVLPGLRDHKGDVEIIAEPNTCVELVDMLLTRGVVATIYTFTVTSANATIGATYTNNSITFTVSATIASQTTLVTTGAGAPLTSGTLTRASGTGDTTITFSAFTTGTSTWPFTLNGNTIPKSKTMDISTGNVVKRFVGVQGSKLVPVFSKNQLNLKISVSALGSFQGAVLLSTPTGSGPYTVVFDPTYDTNPTAKLVVGDLVRFYHSGSQYIDTAIVAITNATTITVTANVTSMVQGDIMYLRPATETLTLVSPFLWSNTQFCFGATASAALSASQTRVEQSSVWECDYSFESDSGSQRSGSADPASLIRTVAKTGLTIKKFFDTADDIINFNQTNKTACVIRHYATSGSTTYELRITLNHLVTDDPLPKLKTKAVNYSSIKYHAQYDTTDAQLFDIKVIDNVGTIG